MVGGLVMGALEKLYRQPSLFAYALLATREVSASPLQKGHKKSAVLPPVTGVQFDCDFNIWIS
jgi:hypothetical protein